MKHTFTLITVAATLTLAQYTQADGFQGTTTEFSKVNVSLTVETNKPQISTSGAKVDSTAKAKINNKTILNMFATWSGADTNEWRTSHAQLIFDWSTYQMAVADKTGTNILLYLGDGAGVNSGTVKAYFTVDWFSESGGFSGSFSALKDKKSTTLPGTDKWTTTTVAFFELSYNDSSNPDTKIELLSWGPNTEHFVQSWDANGTPTKWTDKEMFKPSWAGLREILNGQSRAAISGSIKANGKGSGNNTYLYPLD